MQYLLFKKRKENRMTQEDMANLLGISRNSYGKKERGEVPFDQDEMFTISNHFEENMDKIFLPRKFQIGNKEQEV